MMKFKLHLSPSIRELALSAVLFLCFAINSHAQESVLPETNGAFFAISVLNIDDAVEWYTDHLEFKLESKGGNDQRKGALLSRPGVVLELTEFSNAIHRNDLKPNIESHEIHGIFKIGFITKNLDGIFEKINDSNVEIFFSIVEASDGNRTFGIKDLEGNIIQFFGK